METVLWVFRVGQIPVRFVRFVYLFIFLRLVSNSDFNEKLRRLLFFSFQPSLFGWVSDQTGYSDQIFQRARCT